MVDSVYEPMQARFDFALEGCVDDEAQTVRLLLIFPHVHHHSSIK
jgi:hypothetical protein